MSSSIVPRKTITQLMASRLRLRPLRIVAEQSPGRRRIRIAVCGGAATPWAPGSAVETSRRWPGRTPALWRCR
jgi:hypothetical protein